MLHLHNQNSKNMNWNKVTSINALARELCKVAIRMGEVPKSTHHYNFFHTNKEWIEEEWNIWRRDFPNALHENLTKRK
jgi:hypothetical protein